MEVQMFLTHVPQEGQIGPWVTIERQHARTSAKLSITVFRPGMADRIEVTPIIGEVELSKCATSGLSKVESFNDGMVDIQLKPNEPTPRIRFFGEGVYGTDLRVVVQFRDVTAG